MPKLKQKLEDLLKEKKARAAAREAAPMVDKVLVPEKVIGTKKVKKPARLEWPDLQALSNEKVEEKIRSLPYDDMLELYKKLERKVALRIDPENYKPPVIIRNFMLLWIRNKSDEEIKAAQGEKLVALTRDEVEQVMNNQGRGSRLAPVYDEENDEPF